MDPVLWLALLLALALAFFVLELFVPSGGVLTFAAAGCMLAAIVIGFTVSLKVGAITLGIVTILIPAVLVAAVRWWPETPIGRLILLGRPEHPDDVLPDTELYRGLRRLVGRYGMSETSMLPSGIISIEGKSYDAVSDGVPIEAGTRVLVIDIRTNRVIVRPVSDSLPDQRESSDAERLSKPFESLEIEGLDEMP